MPSARVLRGGELLKQNHTAYATIPSYYAWRQRPIGKGVPKSVDQEMSQQVRWLGRASGCQPCRISPFRTYLLHRVREITPQFPITRKGNCAIWMPGNEAQKRQSWAIGDTGLPIAMSSITTSAIDTPNRRSVERTCDDLAIIVLAAVGLIASLTFRDYGLGWDDYTHAEYADLLLRMYGSGFKDTGALSFGPLVAGCVAVVYAWAGLVRFFLEKIPTQTTRNAARRFIHVVYVLTPGLVLGYLVMGLIWPWSIMEPDNPFHALTYFSHFFEKPWKEMFDGALVSVPDMPWSYLPTLFALQLPEVLLVFRS